MPGVYNTWQGFLAEKLEPVPANEVIGLVTPILAHLRMLCEKDTYFKYVMAWTAQGVQDPSNPTQTCLVMQGEHGSGKNIVFEWMGTNVLGSPAAFQTANPAHDMFGPHCLAAQNCTLAVFDEINGENMKPLMHLIKNYITAAGLNLDPKCKTMFRVRNMLNIICTTSQSDSIVVEPGERHLVVIQTNSSKKGDKSYFRALGAHLKKKGVARAFFQYLRDDVDISPYLPFQEMRPITEAYEALRANYIPLIYRFLSARIRFFTAEDDEASANLPAEPDVSEASAKVTVAAEDDEASANLPAELDVSEASAKVTVTQFKAMEFFQLFQSWAQQGHYKDARNVNLTVFGTTMSTLISTLTSIDSQQETVTKRDKRSGKIYSLNWLLLRQHLEKSALYDSSAVAIVPTMSAIVTAPKHVKIKVDVVATRDDSTGTVSPMDEMLRCEVGLLEETCTNGSGIVGMQTLQTMVVDYKFIALLATRVYETLGSGFSEIMYQKALSQDLSELHIEHEMEQNIPVIYKETAIGAVRADIVVQKKMVIELKRVARITGAHLRQAEMYARLLHLSEIIVINFPCQANTAVEVCVFRDDHTWSSVIR